MPGTEVTSTATTPGTVERLHVDHGVTNRGGIAVLSAMFSRAFVQDVRQARKNGSYPTVDDPARAAQ